MLPFPVEGYGPSPSQVGKQNFSFCTNPSLFVNFFSGFGHLSPGTDLGKVICIVYSLLGVPINGILIGSLGAFFGGKVKLNLTFMALFSFIAYSTVSQIDHTV